MPSYLDAERGNPSMTSVNSSTAYLVPTAGSRSGVYAAFSRSPSNASKASSTPSITGSPYPSTPSLRSHQSPMVSGSMTEKYSISPDFTTWGNDLTMDYKEEDDLLHNPDPRRDKQNDQGGSIFTARGLTNLGCIALLLLALVSLFALYPILTFFTRKPLETFGAFNIGGLNSTGQVPDIANSRGLVDIATPQGSYTRASYNNPSQELQLIWSDEFEVDGRTFYPGDDPYWEAVDLNYWQTGDLEWYDPSALTTRNGSLEITLSLKANHGLNYMSGMMSTWNKFCFTGGLIETRVSLPGANNIVGLWPAVWTMGNLGRAGYGASLEGMWPYTYDSCDVGTLPNQTLNGQPVAAVTVGDPFNGNVLSYLQGQRLSRCTCQGESHPGPKHSDGTYVGRSAPEIDIIEATFGGTPLHGQVSQSLQAAPFNFNYTYDTGNGHTDIYNSTATVLNSYKGGVFQQAISALSDTDQGAYELDGGGFSTYGYEYEPGFNNAYITWIANNKASWTLTSDALQADNQVQIGPRPIPQEPMYILVNLGLSPSFGTIDFNHLQFPATMRVDYVRVYQHPDQINYGCDPKAFPTQAYINQYTEAYTNPNLTTWRDDFGQPFPKNSFAGQC
ncbi:beta-glucan synthesis-associated protein [Vararia minispora EC-137]|uniref:Beta-glucan synthesis-associated protein n=1 Tax=Vararia minispora EC-137 TaxID=1314806 RepID=A0ACB8QYG4_9AGAM|nr:beta-glucan synthesis-associated protein [Vararia minispora EC-137]